METNGINEWDKVYGFYVEYVGNCFKINYRLCNSNVCVFSETQAASTPMPSQIYFTTIHFKYQIYCSGNLINVQSSEVVLTICSSLTALFCNDPEDKIVDGKFKKWE